VNDKKSFSAVMNNVCIIEILPEKSPGKNQIPQFSEEESPFVQKRAEGMTVKVVFPDPK